MHLEQLIVVNYRSCRFVVYDLSSDLPNVLIGFNDSGKSTLLKSIQLLLDDKPDYAYTSDTSGKKDLSNSAYSSEDLNQFLNLSGYPILKDYDENKTIIIGKFSLKTEDIDYDEFKELSQLLRWSVESKPSSCTICRIFDNKLKLDSHYIATRDFQELKLWEKNKREIDSLIAKYDISKSEIENDNMAGPFSNMEKFRAIYRKVDTYTGWAKYPMDKNFFPKVLYLSWNFSLEQLKTIAKAAMAEIIEAKKIELQKQANNVAKEVEGLVNSNLVTYKEDIISDAPTIEELSVKINMNVAESISDILVKKANSDGLVHIESQGDGIKRQIWFALVKISSFKSSSSSNFKRFIWCFDEPETHLHPSAQRKLSSRFRDLSSGGQQVILGTHATTFVDSTSISNIRSVRLYEGYSETLSCKTTEDIFNSLGVTNSDFLFYDKFLIVEGETEKRLFPILFKKYTKVSLQDAHIKLIALDSASKISVAKDTIRSMLHDFKKSSDVVVYLLDNDERSKVESTQEKMFFVGVQDLEDSISDDVWIRLCNFHLSKASYPPISNQDLETVRRKISNSANAPSHEKMLPLLNKHIRQKIYDETGEQVNYKILPDKAALAEELAEHIQSIDQVGEQVKTCFNVLLGSPLPEERKSNAHEKVLQPEPADPNTALGMA